MFWIYLASAIFGGSFLIPMILGGLGSDLEVDGDVDISVDTDLEVDTDVGSEPGADLDQSDTSSVSATVDAGQAIVGSLLSFRSVVFFAAFFGTSGIVFTTLGYNVVLTVVTAVVLGCIAAVANSVLFGLLKSSEVTSQIGERSFEGRPASVTVPIDDGRRGRIRIELAGQPHYLVAESFDGEAFSAGHQVVVVEIVHGIARVASLIDLE